MPEPIEPIELITTVHEIFHDMQGVFGERIESGLKTDIQISIFSGRIPISRRVIDDIQDRLLSRGRWHV